MEHLTKCKAEPRNNTCDKCGGEKLGGGKVCLDCKGRDYYFHKNYSIFNYEDNMQKYINKYRQSGKMQRILIKHLKSQCKKYK